MLRLILALIVVATAAACGPGARTNPPRTSAPPRAPCPPTASAEADEFGERATFALDRRALRSHGASEALLTKLDGSAYRYFRMLGPAFANRTCFEFRAERWLLPVVAVHGDPHLEQFVVTRETFGLEDFDQSGFGPAVVDLVRYGASLHLACRSVSWPCDPASAMGAFLDAYRASLDAPLPTATPPAVVARLRETVPQAQAAWLAWADSLFRPMTAPMEREYRSGFTDFAHVQAAVYPNRADHFFDVVRMGELTMGIGSALDRKVLVRVQGPTDAPGDDVLLEARIATPPRARSCVWRPSHGGSLHSLLFMSLLGRRMPSVYGFVRLDESADAPGYWVQAWDPGYRELAISDVASQAELDELARDAARQLAGHFWSRFPEHLQPLQRRAQLVAFDRTRERSAQLAGELAAEVVVEWERFRTPQPLTRAR